MKKLQKMIGYEFSGSYYLKCTQGLCNWDLSFSQLFCVCPIGFQPYVMLYHSLQMLQCMKSLKHNDQVDGERQQKGTSYGKRMKSDCHHSGCLENVLR
jgi:hypothetical protein